MFAANSHNDGVGGATGKVALPQCGEQFGIANKAARQQPFAPPSG